MLEFFFDCSSPWTYLAFHNVLPLAGEFDLAIGWRPILVGGIFNTINPSVYHSRAKPVPAKVRYAQKDLADWARLAGLKIIRPTIFPVNSVKAMRGCILLAGEDKLEAFASEHGPGFYGLPVNPGRVVLQRAAWTPPGEIPAAGTTVVPFMAGTQLGWKFAGPLEA